MAVPEGDLPPGADALFDLAPEAFTGARDALAKQLRAAKEKAAADAVKALRRPTVTAWVLNQLARRHGGAVADLAAAAEALADAQEQALAGDREPFRAAQARQREVLRRLHDLAAEVLAERGTGAATVLDEVDAALRAAVAEPAVAAELRAGRLSAAPEAGGGFGGALAAFGLAGADSPPSRPRAAAAGTKDERSKHEEQGKKGKKGKDRRDEDGQQGADAQQGERGPATTEPADDATDVDEVEAEVRRKAARKQAETEARLAHRSAELARKRAADAAKVADKAASHLADLEARLRDLQAEVDEAVRTAEDARVAADDAVEDAAQAEARAADAEAAIDAT